jgi:hypothetical protein
MFQPVLNWLESQNLLIKPEFAMPWGICDVVGVSLDHQRATMRLEYGQKDYLGRISAIALLESIPDEKLGRSITLGSLVREFGDFFTPLEIRGEIERLIRKRFIKSPRLNHFQKLNGWMPLHERVITVELKLSRVEEAFFQASNNRSFATESYVAFPSENALRLAKSKRAARFSEAGIGILSIGADACAVLLRSNVPKSLNSSLAQTQLVDRFWLSYQRQLSINC